MNQKIYLTFQQSELDALRMYRALEQRTENEEECAILHELGSIEGKHAAALRRITGRNDLKPTDAMAKPILFLERTLGRKATYVVMAIGEKAAYYLYQPLAKEHPELQIVAKQETEHGNTLLHMVKTLANERRDLPLAAWLLKRG